MGDDRWQQQKGPPNYEKYGEVVEEKNADEDGNNADTSAATWNLCMAALSVNICLAGAGSMTAWTSSAEKFLVIDRVYPGPISRDTWSWVASLYPLGAIFGPVPIGFLMDKLGRKPCLLGIGVMYLSSWTLIAAANGAAMILVARFWAGMANAALRAILPIYTAEISTDGMRATLDALTSFSVTSGYLLSVSIGPHVKPFILAILCGAVAVLFLITFAFTPETPYVLVGRGDLPGARKSLIWLRGKHEATIQKEIAAIQEAQAEARAENTPLAEKMKSLFGEKGNVKGLGIACSLLAFAELSGIAPVLYFSENIFRASGSSFDPATSANILGAVLVIASCGTRVLLRFFRIKSLLILSAFGMVLGHALLGYYFYQKEAGSDVSALEMLPVAALVIFMAFFCFGFSALPWAIVGEVFGNNVKAMASALENTVSNLLAFLLSWQFSTLLDVLRPAWTFWSFGMICALAGVFSIVVVPNTRGKSPLEIQDMRSGHVRKNFTPSAPPPPP